jgi:hypothetical protein
MADVEDVRKLSGGGVPDCGEEKQKVMRPY